jgi:PPE-repeat protein
MVTTASKEMGLMDFGLLPPEVNSGLMYSGPGVGPMLSSAASWEALAAELESAASGYSSEIAGLAGRWLGPSSMRMAAAGARHAAWLQASAGHAGETAARAYTAAAAYETAYAMTVPPPVIAANRVQLMTLISTNFLGQNTPAIAATEAQYAEMWVQDATAMYGYAADAETASTLTSFDEPSQTTNPDGPLEQARALAQTTGDATTQQLSSALSGNTTHVSGSVNISTTYTVGAGDTLIIDNGGVLTVQSGASLTVQAGGNLIIQSGGSLVNGGTVTINGALTVESGGAVTLSPGSVLGVGSGGSLANAGTIAINGGSFGIGSGGSLYNTGAINISGAVFTPPPHPGSFTIAPGGTATVEAGGTVNVGLSSSVSVGGNLTVGPGGTIAATNGGSVNVSLGGNVAVSGGAVNIGSSSGLAIGTGGTVTVSHGGAVTFASGGIGSPAMLNIFSTGANGSSLIVGPGGTVTIGSTGHGLISGGGTISVNGGSLIVAPHGVLTFPSGSVIVGPGEVVTIGPGGTVTIGGYLGPVTVAPPIPAAASASPSGLSSLLASPGLAGNAGIQPQVNFDALLDALS